MKLSKIAITHFRCFESLTVDLKPDVNVFVGINAAGKTAILDAIAIALYDIVRVNGGHGKRQRGGHGKRQRDSQHASLRPADLHVVARIADMGKSTIERKDFVHLRATAHDLYQAAGFKSQIDWDNDIRYSPPNEFRYSNSGARDLETYLLTLWDQIGKEPDALIPLPVVAYYRASRRLAGMPALGNIFDLRLDRQLAFRDAMNAGSDYQAMCQWFYLRENDELRLRQGPEYGPTYELPDLKAIRQALAGTLRRVKRVYFDGNPPSLKVALDGGDENVLPLPPLELEQLSDGYRNLLSVVMDFARRLALAHPNWDDPLSAPGILLIDEIDLHLHPTWQQEIIPNLRRVFPNTQLILSTHSPAVLTTVERQHIHLIGDRHLLESIPSDVGTLGAESSRVMAEIFGTHVRPPTVEATKKLSEYLSLVERGQYDSDSTRELRKQLEVAMGSGDPDLQRADMRAAQLKVLKAR